MVKAIFYNDIRPKPNKTELKNRFTCMFVCDKERRYTSKDSIYEMYFLCGVMRKSLKLSSAKIRNNMTVKTNCEQVQNTCIS